MLFMPDIPMFQYGSKRDGICIPSLTFGSLPAGIVDPKIQTVV
jgi:hypothetical protein